MHLMQLLLQKKNGFKFINLLFECFMPTSNIFDLLIYDSVTTIRAYKNALSIKQSVYLSTYSKET